LIDWFKTTATKLSTTNETERLLYCHSESNVSIGSAVSNFGVLVDGQRSVDVCIASLCRSCFLFFQLLHCVSI